MARKARLRLANAVYHIYQHGMYEINLFSDNQDKEYFLYLIKKYKYIYKIRIFAYCIMTTHYHLLINPSGADISKVMHSINQCYAQYYNKKYKRKGHVFSGRFESNIALDNEGILIMSAYIHNNPKDISNYADRVEEYPYCSFGIYANIFKDTFNLIEQEFLLSYYFQGNDFYKHINEAKVSYYQFIKKLYPNCYNNSSYKDILNEAREIKLNNIFDIKEDSIKNKNSLDEHNIFNIKRDIDPSKIIDILKKQLHLLKMDTKNKSICILIIRCLSNISYTEISKYFNNESESYLSRLCNKGYRLMAENEVYNKVLESFI